MICYSQVNAGHWCQEHYDSASRDAGRRVRQLRKAGWAARSVPLGVQVTPVGRVRMTMVDIRPTQEREDTFGLPTEQWALSHGSL